MERQKGSKNWNTVGGTKKIPPFLFGKVSERNNQEDNFLKHGIVDFTKEEKLDENTSYRRCRFYWFKCG